MSKDRAKTDTELLFEKMNPNLPKNLSKYKFGKSFKDPKTGETKVELIKKDKKKTKFWRILKKREGKQDVLLEKRKKARQEPLDMNKGGVVKRYKGGLMVKPKAAKRGY